MASWQERAWRLAEQRERRPVSLREAIWALLRAGVLGGQADGPHMVGEPWVGVCPVCNGPTATHWSETRPTPCTKCRARIVASMVTDRWELR